MTILEEAHHTLIIIEHDPILCDSQEMIEYIFQAMKQAACEATVLLYSPRIDPFLEDLAKVLIGYFTLRKGQDPHRGCL
jgi:hypothetical protein